MKLVLGMEVGLSPGDFMLDGDLAPLPQKGCSPSSIFGPFLLWPNGWMHLDATWYGCRPQPRGLCVRWRTSHPCPTRGGAPKFLAHVYCGQNDWMDQDVTWYGGRPPLTRHCVRCGPSYAQRKGHTHSHAIFGLYLLWPNGWMDEDATWYRSRPRPRPHCTRRVPAPVKGAQHPALFGHYLLWPRLPISATAELLFSIVCISRYP